jgi:hypothetical protein
MVATVGLLAVALDGCYGGIGIPKQQPGETYPGERREVAGTIEIDGYGCIRVRLDDGTSDAAIWPSSANQGQDDYVNLGWFQSDLGDGDRVRGTAAVIPLASLRGWEGEGSGYWRYALGACVEDGETQAIVFDSAEGVGD